MSAELSRRQLSSLQRRFGTRSRPVNASEHWRYGAFLHLLRRVKNEEALIELLSVAHTDPDKSMGRGLSQAQFAAALKISPRTLQQWEQGRRQPSGAAETLLKIVARHPEVLREVMAA